jgi:hypothetical protein
MAGFVIVDENGKILSATRGQDKYNPGDRTFFTDCHAAADALKRKHVFGWPENCEIRPAVLIHSYN